VFYRSPEYSLKGSEKVGEKVGERVGDKLTANQQRIIELISAFSTISARELAEKVGISPRKVEENIAKLRLKGFLKRVGPDKGGHWEIT
jgi:ATP-dependent DNA helicase RecG